MGSRHYPEWARTRQRQASLWVSSPGCGQNFATCIMLGNHYSSCTIQSHCSCQTLMQSRYRKKKISELSNPKALGIVTGEVSGGAGIRERWKMVGPNGCMPSNPTYQGPGYTHESGPRVRADCLLEGKAMGSPSCAWHLSLPPSDHASNTEDSKKKKKSCCQISPSQAGTANTLPELTAQPPLLCAIHPRT